MNTDIDSIGDLRFFQPYHVVLTASKVRRYLLDSNFLILLLVTKINSVMLFPLASV